jgi:hypothetical protein
MDWKDFTIESNMVISDSDLNELIDSFITLLLGTGQKDLISAEETRGVDIT